MKIGNELRLRLRYVRAFSEQQQQQVESIRPPSFAHLLKQVESIRPPSFAHLLMGRLEDDIFVGLAELVLPLRTRLLQGAT